MRPRPGRKRWCRAALYFPAGPAGIAALRQAPCGRAAVAVVPLQHADDDQGRLRSAETVRQLLDNARIVGVKDSSGDLGYFEQVAGHRPRAPRLERAGGPRAFAGRRCRARRPRGVNGGANLYPRLFVELYEAACRRECGPDRRVAARGVQARADLPGRPACLGDHQGPQVRASRCAAFATTCWPSPSTASRAPCEKVRQLLEQLDLS